MRWCAAFLAGGCVISESATEVAGTQVDPVVAPDRGPGFKGPGEWRAAAKTVAPGVHVSLVRDLQNLLPDTFLASASGDRVLFTSAGNACASDAATGFMETDVDTQSESDTGTTSPDDTEVLDSFADDDLLVRTGAGLIRVDVSTGAITDLGRGASVARVVDDAVVTVSADCQVQFDDGAAIALDTPSCGSVAALDGHLLVAAGDRVLEVAPDGRVGALSLAADRVAADPVSGVVAGAVIGGPSLVSNGWIHSVVGSSIHSVHDAGPLGVFVIDGEIDGDRLAWVVDAATGEQLGVLDLRDQSVSIDVSASGGLLLQERAESMTSWRIER